MKGDKKLNYLKEILTFENWIEYNSGINKSDIRLWYTLMHTANRFAWKEFTISISVLIFKSKLSKSDIYRARNKLKQLGLIDFKERSGNQCTIYKMNSVVSQFGSQNETEIDTEVETPFNTPSATANDPNPGNINKIKTKNININKKEIIKEKFGEFENVLLSTEEFDKLKSKLGTDCNDYIERLSNYIASTGKRYKSHYATILSWIQKDNQNKKTGGESYDSSVKSSTKRLCTEYPE